MLRSHLISSVMLAAALMSAGAQADVHVEPTHLQGPRPLQEQTQEAAIRDYLQAWQTVGAALSGNDATLLDRDFVGGARAKLAQAIAEQAAFGLRTRYQDKSHDIQIVFYSPDGLSIELTDDVEYNVQIFDHDKAPIAQQVRERYIVVLTPAEVRWRVRVFQGQLPE